MAWEDARAETKIAGRYRAGQSDGAGNLGYGE
jgi:hypothetical protein